jgi:hypothetical protein
VFWDGFGGSVPIVASSRRATSLAEANFQAFHLHLCVTVTLQDARTLVPPKVVQKVAALSVFDRMRCF